MSKQNEGGACAAQCDLSPQVNRSGWHGAIAKAVASIAVRLSPCSWHSGVTLIR